MKSLGTKAFVLLFAGLIVGCAFEGPPAQASPPSAPQEESSLCVMLNGVSLQISHQSEPASQASTGEFAGPLPEGYPLWSLAQSIDHPPEQAA